MPYINVHIGKTLSEETKMQLMHAIADCAAIIPYRNINNTMIEISDGRDMYMGGEKKDLIFVDMRVWGNVDLEIKNKLIDALQKEFKTLLGIENNKLYFNMIELNEWGMGSSFEVMK